MQKFMVVHRDPDVSWEKIEENWSKLANVESATWIRTYFNRNLKVRHCLWLAPNVDSLKKIFAELDVPFESILEVEETVPDLWGKKWKEHLAEDSKADTLAF